MEDMCTGCLSKDRKLFFIGETGYYHLYSQILNEIPVYDLSQVCVRVCWECRARLRSMQLFKQQVQRNYSNLMQRIPPQVTSSMSKYAVHNLSYPEIKSEDEIEVKSESVEHCEPDPFASTLSVEQDMGPEPGQDMGPEPDQDMGPAPDKDKVKVKPLKKKRTPKIKLKSTKIKVKKKRRKKSIENLTDESDDVRNDDNIDENIDDNIEDNHIEESLNESSNKDTKEVSTKKKVIRVLTNAVFVKRVRSTSPLPDRPQCKECGKVFSSKKTYRYHLNVLHKGQNQHPCPRCGKVYQWKSNLGRHMRSHRAVDDGELHCALCDKSFASVATYRQHLRISRRHVPETEFSFACDACGKRFVSKTRLRDHVDWEHLNRIKFRCQHCDKPFKCHTSLYVHTQNVHVGKERKENLCHVCGKSYQNAAKLKYHITAMHSGETPYRCASCGAAFGWYSSLYRHVREVHHKLKGVPKKGKKLKQTLSSPAPAPLYAPL